MKITLDNQDHEYRAVVGNSPMIVSWQDDRHDTGLDDIIRAFHGLLVALGWSDHTIKSGLLEYSSEYREEVEAVDEYLSRDLRRGMDEEELIDDITEEVKKTKVKKNAKRNS